MMKLSLGRLRSLIVEALGRKRVVELLPGDRFKKNQGGDVLVVANAPTQRTVGAHDIVTVMAHPVGKPDVVSSHHFPGFDYEVYAP